MAKRLPVAAALGLALGLALAHALYRLPAWWPLPVALGGAAICLALWRHSRRHFAALVAATAFFTLGAPLYRIAAPEAVPVPRGYGNVAGTVSDVLLFGTNAADYILKDVTVTYPDGSVLFLQGKTMLVGASQDGIAMPGQRLAVSKASVQVPRGPRNPGGFNAKMYGFTQGYRYTAYADGDTAVSGAEDALPASLVRARIGLLAATDELWPGSEENPIVKALLLGDTTSMPDEMRETFSLLGIAHILAVSGLHLGFVLMLLEGVVAGIMLLLPRRFSYLFGRLRIPRAVLVMLGMVAYAALTGFSPSTLRALVMSCVVLAARASASKSDGLTTLGVAVTVMLLIRPMDLFSLSFQLSAGAVGGIFLLSKELEKLLRRIRLPKYLASSLSVTLAAQTGTLPMVARGYGRVPLLGLLANLFAVPLAGAVVMAGIPSVALYTILPRLARVAAYPVTLCARLLARLADASANQPFVSVEVAAPSMAMCMFFLIGVWLVSPYGRSIRRKLRRALCIACAGVSAIAVAAWLLSLYPLTPVVTTLDVGQGHASIVRSGSNALLFDAGNTRAALDAAKYYGLHYDAVFLSHGDLDHAGELAALLRTGKIRSLYVPAGLDGEAEPARSALRAAQEAGIPIIYVSAGDAVAVGDLRVDIHAPLPGRPEKGSNANMLVASVVRKGVVEALFTGDLNRSSEKDIPLPHARVLQVAHHGADGATSAAFLRVVLPEIAVIPVGANSYGHPGEALLSRLADEGARTERTDEAGAVEITMTDILRVKRWGRER